MPVLRCLAAILMTLCASATARAAWPERPVRIIVPIGAGGSTDSAARLIAQALSRNLGQPFLVENRGGNQGVSGVEAALQSPADGYTLLITLDTFVSNPHIYNVKYDVQRDVMPIVQLTRQPIVLAVHPSLGVSTLAELVAKAKAEPGLRYGTGSGFGSRHHMVAHWFATRSGIDLQQVGYRGGGQVIADLVAGEIKIASLGSTPLVPYMRDGTLRLLAQSTGSRAAALPDVPTFAEAGVADLVAEQWLGAFVPTGTPWDVAETINAELNRVINDPVVRTKLRRLAQETVGGTAEDMGRLMKADYETYGRLARTLNVGAP